MVARPEFFTWPAEQQLRWRVQLPDDDRSAIVTALLRTHGRLCCLTLSMAAWHLCDALQDTASAQIDTRIPHRHVRGPKDSQRDARGNIRWNMRVDANGHEALLDALQRRVWDEQSLGSQELAQLDGAQHDDLLNNVDSNVVPLREKSKLMSTPMPCATCRTTAGRRRDAVTPAIPTQLQR